MKKLHFHIWIGVAVSLMAAVSCNLANSKKVNRRVTLWKTDKIPYGTYYAFENLGYLFPNAKIIVNTRSPAKAGKFPAFSRANLATVTGGKKAYLIIASQVVPDEDELEAMMHFVGNGNHIFISCFHAGDSLLSRLKIHAAHENSFFNNNDTLGISVHSPVTYDSLWFDYPGMAADSYVTSMDSEYTTILGRDAKGRADFVRFNYKGGGTLYLHFAPLAFSNYFLLHENNKAYYDNVLSYIPQSVTEVRWDEYFRYPVRANFSAFSYILNNRSLRWGFWLLLLLFLLIYLFGSKRKQRLIPVIPPLRNSSLDFVKTIGRLYYQQRDNNNLAAKLSTHFMDYVSTTYNLPPSLPEEEFVNRLAFKSGFDKQELHNILYTIKMIRDYAALSDEDLLAFNAQIQAFYKHS